MGFQPFSMNSGALKHETKLHRLPDGAIASSRLQLRLHFATAIRQQEAGSGFVGI
jgi:hypothetical protein